MKDFKYWKKLHKSEKLKEFSMGLFLLKNACSLTIDNISKSLSMVKEHENQ